MLPLHRNRGKRNTRSMKIFKNPGKWESCMARDACIDDLENMAGMT